MFSPRIVRRPGFFTPLALTNIVLPRFQLMRGKLLPPARGRLLAIVSQRSLYWNVRHAENDGRAIAAVHVLVKRPSRHGKNVLFLPVQPLAVDHRVASRVDHVVANARGVTMALGVLSRAQ